MGEILGTLNFDGTAFLVNAFGFLIVFAILWKFFFTPVGAVLDTRRNDIAATYDQLEADKREMSALRTDYEQRLANIEAEAREKIQTAIKEAQATRDQIVTEAQLRSRELVTRAESEAERERQQAMITMRQQIVDLALNAATKVIGENLDDTRNRRLVDDFIAKESAALNGAEMGAAYSALPAQA